MKVITIFLSVILLYSAISAVIPAHDSFADDNTVKFSLDKQSYTSEDTIIITGEEIHSTPNSVSQINIYKVGDANPKWTKFVAISDHFTIPVVTSGWASGDYTFVATNGNVEKDVIINFKILPKNFADITYNPITHDALVTWDFGNRETCYSKTDVGLNYFNNNTLTYNSLTNAVTVTFLGTAFSPVYKIGFFSNAEILNEKLTIISCSGEFTFNISNFQVLENFDGFEFWTSFYAVIDGKFHQLNEVGMQYSENTKGSLYNCNEHTPRHYTDYYYNKNTATKIVGKDNPVCDYIDEEHQGVILYDYTPVDTITVHDYPIVTQQQEKKKKNGGGCGDCVPPTIGLNQAFQRVVDYGFSYNGNKVQVDKWYTSFPLINATIGEMNLVETKTYENNGISNMKLVQYCLGAIEKGMPLEKCEVLIEVHLETNGTNDWINVKKIKIKDKDNLIENETVTAKASVVQCMDENPSSNCVKVDLEYEYREQTFNHMMIVNVVDKRGNSQNFHFNEGVMVIGESVNEPPTITKFEKHSSQQADNLYNTYTRTDKFNDTWIDQNGIEYHYINDGFERITPLDPWTCDDKPLSEYSDGGNRDNCHFPDLLDEEVKKTLGKMSEICPSCLLPSFYEMKESFAYDVMPRIDKLNDPTTILLLESEAHRALEYLQSQN